MNQSSFHLGERFWLFLQGIGRLLSAIPVPLLFVLVFTLVLLLLFLLNRKATPEASQDEAEEILPPHGGIITEYLIEKGRVKVGQISATFLRVITFIKHNFPVKDPLYQLPWYLVMGFQQSGKSTLFEKSGLHLPFGKMDFDKGDDKLKFWFLDHGLFIEPKGGDFAVTPFDPQATTDYKKVIKTLIYLLKRYRMARPLNGVVITISCKDLYDLDDHAVNHLHHKTLELAKMLADIQRQIGLKLPLYVILTHMDLIPGFHSFTARLPAFCQKNMWGWSTPDTPLSVDDCAHQSFDAMMNHIYQLRLSIFATYGDSAHNQGVFLFPEAFEMMRMGFDVYLTTLLSPLEEGFLFRGVYGTGQMDHDHPNSEDVIHTMETASGHYRGADTDPLTLIQESHPHAQFSAKSLMLDPPKAIMINNIGFVHDLFYVKIFKEGGLATPMPHYSHQKIRYTKTITTAGFVLCIYGSWSAFHHFVKSRERLTPVIHNIQMVLRESGHIKKEIYPGQLSMNEKGATLFAMHTRQIIDMMNQIEKTVLFSYFVPASWFSPLNGDLKNCLHVAFHELIIHAIANGLSVKALELLQMNNEETLHTKNVATLLTPAHSIEFQKLQKFVYEFNQLITYLAMMQSLKITGEPAHLRALLGYTFHKELPTDFWAHYETFRTVLRKITIQPLYLEELRKAAMMTLGKLFEDFLNALFSTTASYGLPHKIEMIVTMLNDPNTPPDVVSLKRLSQHFIKGLHQREGEMWIDQPTFNPAPEIAEFFQMVATSRVFGHEAAQFLQKQANVGLQSLQQNLRQLQEKMTVQGHYPSHILFVIKYIFETLFQQDFMKTPEIAPPFVTQLLPSQISVWDDTVMNTIQDMIEHYDTFMLKTLPLLPKTTHEKIQHMAVKNLTDNIDGLMRQGQQLKMLNPQDVADLKTTATQFDHKAFTYLFAHFPTLHPILLHSGLTLLKMHEDLLQPLFTLQNITTWDPKQPGAFFHLWGVADQQALMHVAQSYITQVQDISQAVKPLLAFLAVKEPVVQKFQTIMTDLEAFQNKTPGNTVQPLYDFMTQPKIDVDDVLKTIPIANLQTPSPDFFSEKLRLLQKTLRQRCEMVKRQQSIAAIVWLTDFFNTHMAHRFPFTLPTDAVTDDIEPEVMRDFFTHYDLAGGSAEKILDQVYQLGGKTQEITTFFNQMDGIKALFEPFLTGQTDMPALDITVDFRANRRKEKDGDMVIDWAMTLDPLLRLNKTDHQSGQWFYKSPVTVEFRWPFNKTMPIHPEADPQNPALTIQEQTAIFTYTGPWALLHLILKHQAPLADHDGTLSDNTILLRFDVPTDAGPNEEASHETTATPQDKSPNKSPSKPQNKSKAVLFNGLRIMGSPLKSKPFPTFPDKAPPLDSAIIQLGQFPVLTDAMTTEAPLVTKKVTS